MWALRVSSRKTQKFYASRFWIKTSVLRVFRCCLNDDALTPQNSDIYIQISVVFLGFEFKFFQSELRNSNFFPNSSSNWLLSPPTIYKTLSSSYFSPRFLGRTLEKRRLELFCLKIFPIPSGTRLTCLKFHSNFHRNYSGKAPIFHRATASKNYVANRNLKVCQNSWKIKII